MASRKLTVTYKVLFVCVFGVFTLLLLTRLAVAIFVRSPSPSLIECMRDVTRWIEFMLAALLGMLGGRAAK